VENGDRVEVQLPRQVRVRLTYREPVLNVAGLNKAVGPPRHPAAG